MKTTLQAVLLSLFACAFLFSSVPAFADGDEACTEDPPYSKAALKRAKEAESAGKTVQAYLLYGKILFCGETSGIKEVRAGEQRILRKLALAREKKGIIRSSYASLFKHVEDANCAKIQKKYEAMEEITSGREGWDSEALKGPDTECDGSDRAEFDESYGAFNILWGLGLTNDEARDYAEADAVLMRGVKPRSKDFEFVKFAVEHFSSEAAGRKDAGYTPDPAYSRELNRIAAQNTEDLLVKEDKTFQDKTISISITDELSNLPPAGRSLRLLKDAKDWASIANKQLTDKVLARAKKRGGDTLDIDKKSPSPVTLSDAVSFYEFAGDDDAVRKLKAVADKRGEESASKGEASEALVYFRISGNNKRAEEARSAMKIDLKKKNPMKAKKDKKQFNKEADDLEKELGM